MKIEKTIEIVKEIRDEFVTYHETGMAMGNWEVSEEEVSALDMAIDALTEKKKWMDAVTTTQGFDPEHLTPQDKQDIMDALVYLKEKMMGEDYGN